MNDQRDEVNHVLNIMAAGGLFGLVFGVIRGVVNQKHGGWAGFVRGALASVAAAVLVALGIADLGLSLTKQAALIGVSAYLADDVLLGLVNLGRMFGTDPIGFVRDVIRSLKGGNSEVKK